MFRTAGLNSSIFTKTQLWFNKKLAFLCVNPLSAFDIVSNRFCLSLHCETKLLKKMKILYSNFQRNLRNIIDRYSTNSIFVIIDQQVHQILSDSLLDALIHEGNAHIYRVEATEKAKSINEVIGLWQWLVEKGANRKSLILNIGGGIITDLGGFVAATFKRGCDFINIPTTLMAMVDASIGGKTGINFYGLKNEIGAFADPKAILINIDFLHTLPSAAIKDGYVEMLKYGFISGKNLLEETYSTYANEAMDWDNLLRLIKKEIKIKQHLAKVDKYDQKERRALNFGHTFGHAFEAFAAEKHFALSHGTAVAWGMVCELYLSMLRYDFPKSELLKLHYFVKENYSRLFVGCTDFDSIYSYMCHDKKNSDKEINFTLLEDVGRFHYNQKASQTEIYEALEYVCL